MKGFKLPVCVCGCELNTVPLMSETGLAQQVVAAALNKSSMKEMVRFTAISFAP